MTEEVISALDRVLDFYERDYKSINLDGIFGLRVAQGELNIDQISDIWVDWSFYQQRMLVYVVVYKQRVSFIYCWLTPN